MKADGKSNTKKRKRGVIASRAKLEKALLLAGIKTQLSLANKIAENENIETPPKDLVNKVFREVPVSHSSIQRIANALGVEAYTLYQTQKELEFKEEVSDEVLIKSAELSKNKPAKQYLRFLPFSAFFTKTTLLNKVIVSFLLLAVIVVSGTYFLLNTETNSNGKIALLSEREKVLPDLPPRLGRYSIVILYDEKSEKLYKALEQLLSESVNVLPSISSAIAKIKEQSPDDILSSLQVDYVLTISNLNKGRYQSHVVHLQDSQQDYLIWSKFSTLTEFETSLALISDDISNAVMQALGLVERNIILPSEQLTSTARMFYLEGLDLLDGSQNQLNVKGAQSRFANVISYAPDFAQAYAGLCEALLMESWTNDEKEMIKSAQPMCEKALALAPNNDHVIAAQSLFLRKTGRVKEAIRLLHKQIELSPFSDNLLYLTAYAEYDAHHQFSDASTFLQDAKDHAMQAIEVDPTFWKSYFLLGIISWSSNDLDTAREALKKARFIDANELVLSNLGVLSMCIGDVSAASEYFKESMSVSPDSYMGYEMLGLTHFYNGHFQQSIEYRLQALKNAGSANIPQIWGDLADSYYALGDWDNASKNYQKALTIIESGRVLGNDLVSDHALQLYYLHRLAIMNKQDSELSVLVEDELNKSDFALMELDAPSQVKLAIAYFETNKLQQAESYFRRSIETCPVYSQHPNIVEFAKMLNLDASDLN